MDSIIGFKIRILLLIFPLLTLGAKAQFTPENLRLIPVAGLNFGSQTPKVGSSLGLMLNYSFSPTASAGLGLEYMSDIGTGKPSFPLYVNLRSNFASPVFSKPSVFLFMLRSGMDIRNDQYFKTGFFAAAEIAYRWRNLSIHSISLPAFYTGAEFIYNKSRFEDSYRDYLISDGYLTQIIFQLKLSVEIPNKIQNHETL